LIIRGFEMKKSFILSVVLGLILGLTIAWIDSRPNWDDTGISVLLLLAAAMLCGFLASRKPWMIALVVSIWIPLTSICITHNYGGFMALVPGFIGAYAGWFIKRNLKAGKSTA
jgi:hypothetical protein